MLTASVAQDPEQRRLTVTEVPPAADRRPLRDQRLTGAERCVALAEPDLDEAGGDGDRLDALMDQRRAARLAARQPDEDDPQAGIGVVEQRHRAAGAALRRVEPARQAVAGAVRAAQQVVERDAEPAGEIDERVEREPGLAAL